ncbi:DegT/DnrJ/EryC1/StrS family aminotransferase [Novipirellula sp. SH528]|uniref:DegT/DnrJ/EryC1/StrS family aminotransferase n=1 Tax=Novipirellula sp. SH528 TaxID=3454466 RepID=UPI003FA0B74E
MKSKEFNPLVSELATFGGPCAVRCKVDSQWPPSSPQLQVEVQRVLDSGRLSINDGTGVIREFETGFAQYTGSKHSLAFCNGTAALHSALFAVGVCPGDEVIVPTLTWPSTANAVIQCGARPVFCDVDISSGCMNADAIQAKLSPATRAVIAVHLWGNPGDIAEVARLTKRVSIPLIEDASHAHGAQIEGRHVGTYGEIGCFSLQASKLLAAGEAGIAVTNSTDLFDKMLAHGHFGGRIERDVTSQAFAQYSYTGIGPKYRPHPLAMAIALSSLQQLDSWINHRTDAIDRISVVVEQVPGLIAPERIEGVSRGAFYGVRVRHVPSVSGVSTEALLRLLTDEGVEVSREPYQLLHRQPLYKGAMFYEEVTGSRWPYGEKWSATYRDSDFLNAIELSVNTLAITVPTLATQELVDGYKLAFEKIRRVISIDPAAIQEAMQIVLTIRSR